MLAQTLKTIARDLNPKHYRRAAEVCTGIAPTQDFGDLDALVSFIASRAPNVYDAQRVTDALQGLVSRIQRVELAYAVAASDAATEHPIIVAMFPISTSSTCNRFQSSDRARADVLLGQIAEVL